MTSLLDIQKTILDQLQAGEFVKGMEDFYAEDFVNKEASGVHTEGKATVIANEVEFLKGVKTFHSCTVHSFGVGDDDGHGNGTTFAEYDLRVDLQSGETFNPKQVQVTRWRDGKAVSATFYYDPAKL